MQNHIDNQKEKLEKKKKNFNLVEVKVEVCNLKDPEFWSPLLIA